MACRGVPLQAAAPARCTRLRRTLLLSADLAGVIGESFAPQGGEEARHVLRVEVTVRARRGDEEHRRFDLWTIFGAVGRTTPLATCPT
jgi:hypothetical protein